MELRVDKYCVETPGKIWKAEKQRLGTAFSVFKQSVDKKYQQTKEKKSQHKNEAFLSYNGHFTPSKRLFDFIMDQAGV